MTVGAPKAKKVLVIWTFVSLFLDQTVLGNYRHTKNFAVSRPTVSNLCDSGV